MTDTPGTPTDSHPLQRTARKADFSMYGSPDFREAPPAVVGFDLSHVPEGGEEDPMSAAIMAVGTSAARLIQSPGEAVMVRSALDELAVLGRAIGGTFAADFAENVSTLLDLVEDCVT